MFTAIKRRWRNVVTRSLCQHLFDKAVSTNWDAHRLFLRIERKPPRAGAQTLMQMKGEVWSNDCRSNKLFKVNLYIANQKKTFMPKNKRQTNDSKSLSVLLRAVHLRGSHLPLCLSQTHTSRMDRRLIRSPSLPLSLFIETLYPRAQMSHTAPTKLMSEQSKSEQKIWKSTAISRSRPARVSFVPLGSITEDKKNKPAHVFYHHLMLQASIALTDEPFLHVWNFKRRHCFFAE